MTDRQRSDLSRAAQHYRAVAWRIADRNVKIACLVQALSNYQEAGLDDLAEMMRRDIEILRSYS